MIRFRKLFKATLPRAQMDVTPFDLGKKLAGHIVPLGLASKPPSLKQCEMNINILKRVLSGVDRTILSSSSFTSSSTIISRRGQQIAFKKESRQQKATLSLLRSRVNQLDIQLQEMMEQDRKDRAELKKLKTEVRTLQNKKRKQDRDLLELSQTATYHANVIEVLRDKYDELKVEMYEVPYFVGMRHVAQCLARELHFELIMELSSQTIKAPTTKRMGVGQEETPHVVQQQQQQQHDNVMRVRALHTGHRTNVVQQVVSTHHSTLNDQDPIAFLEECIRGNIYSETQVDLAFNKVLPGCELEAFLSFAKAACRAADARSGPGPMDEGHLMKAVEVLQEVHKRLEPSLDTDTLIVNKFANKMLDFARKNNSKGNIFIIKKKLNEQDG